MTTVVEAQLSSVRVVAEFRDAPLAARTFAAIWGASGKRTYTEASISIDFRIERQRGGFRVKSGDGFAIEVTDEGAVCPHLELRMYEAFLDAEQAARRAVLHASGVVRGETTFIFAGISGSGKSALARAALEAGLQYFADEHVITDGSAVWGVPRAVHLDLEPIGAVAQPWHVGANRDSYVFPSPRGVLRLPFVEVDAACVVEAARPLAHAVLVELTRSERDDLTPLSAPGRLQLVERSHFLSAKALSAVALLPRAFSMTWREPSSALSLLLTACERGDGRAHR